MSRMADVDAELSELAVRMVEQAAEAMSSSVWGATARDVGRARVAVAMALRELEVEIGRRLIAGECFVDLESLITYVEGGQPAPDPNREPRRWPPNSPEPDVKPGFEVRSTVNGVVFRRDHWGTWVAQPPIGDGHPYDWSRLNSEIHAEGGMELIEVVEGGQVDGQ